MSAQNGAVITIAITIIWPPITESQFEAGKGTTLPAF